MSSISFLLSNLDYDGVNEQPVDLADVSTYPALFDKLAEEGHGYEPWTSNELKKLAGLNLIRVFREVEAVRDALQKELPYDTPIPYEDLTRDNPTQGCRTDLEKYRKQYKHLLENEQSFVPVELMGLKRTKCKTFKYVAQSLMRESSRSNNPPNSYVLTLQRKSMLPTYNTHK